MNQTPRPKGTGRFQFIQTSLRRSYRVSGSGITGSSLFVVGKPDCSPNGLTLWDVNERAIRLPPTVSGKGYKRRTLRVPAHLICEHEYCIIHVGLDDRSFLAVWYIGADPTDNPAATAPCMVDHKTETDTPVVSLMTTTHSSTVTAFVN